MTSENLFFSLPKETRRKIDSAFDAVCKQLTAKARSEEIPAGGFIPDSGGFIRDNEGESSEGGFMREEGSDGGFLRDEPSDLGGGFVNDDDDEDEQKPSENIQIPLSLVPSALQYLDLPPDDEEVLAVFRNAATGWTSSNSNANSLGQNPREDQYVSRDDWRSVCAVLLEHDGPETDVEMAEPGTEFDGAADFDEHQDSEAEGEEVEDDDDGEYIEGPSTSAVRRRTRLTAQKSPSTSLSPSPTSPDNRSHKLTSRQRQTCIDAYSLFFPTATTEELLSQKIMIKDLQRVAKLLNEKLRTEDVSSSSNFFESTFENMTPLQMVEMLEAFSTSPDKSMNFEGFCRMMIKAKLA